MEKNLLIELLETGEKVSLYSPRFEGEEYTDNITQMIPPVSLK